MTPDWTDLEHRLGTTGLAALSRQAIEPAFEALSPGGGGASQKSANPTPYLFGGFIAFVALFMTLERLMPNTFWGQAINFMLFPVLFVGCILGGLWLGRGLIARRILRGQAVYIERAKAWKALADRAGVTYVPAPGGAGESLRWLARQPWAAAHIAPIADLLDSHGGMDEAVEAARKSGVLVRNTTVAGTPEQRAQMIRQMNDMQSVEDGFEGQREGVRFSLFEWGEREGDGPDTYHLVLVLTAPQPLRAVTQLRTRKGRWPLDDGSKPLLPVDLGARAFDARFDVRTSDQVEARLLLNPAVMERLIAVPEAEEIVIAAQGPHVVIDMTSPQGRNRFDLISVPLGVWSDDTIRQGVADLAEALSLVDVFAHALMVRRV